MVDFFKNIAQNISPIISTLAGKVDECQENGKVDMPLFENFATQLGMSEETYAQLEDTFFDLAEIFLDYAEPALNLAASMADDVTGMVIENISGSDISSISSGGDVGAIGNDSTVNGTQPVPATSGEDDKPAVGASPETDEDTALYTDNELNEKLDDINACLDTGNQDEFEKIWNDMSSEQQAQVMEAYDGNMLNSLSNAFVTNPNKAELLNSVAADVSKAEKGSDVLAKELQSLLNSEEVPDFATINSILKNDEITSENSIEIMKKYDKLVNPTSDPEGRSLIDDICATKNLLSADKLEILNELSKDLDEQSKATGNSYATEKDKIATAIEIVNDFIASI